MQAEAARVGDRAEAMLEQRRLLRGHARQVVPLHLIGIERRRLEERDSLVQNRFVARPGDVDADRVRQPKKIVRTTCPRATTYRRMPPVLHVAFHELSRRREQDVCAADIRTGVDQGEDVLQLISEPERAARLIRSGPCPDPGAQCLVRQPAVHNEIEGIIRRVHADGAEHVIPGLSGRSERVRSRGE